MVFQVQSVVVKVHLYISVHIYVAFTTFGVVDKRLNEYFVILFLFQTSRRECSTLQFTYKKFCAFHKFQSRNHCIRKVIIRQQMLKNIKRPNFDRHFVQLHFGLLIAYKLSKALSFC